ncbi:Septum formation [Arthrobacter alpinus]|uniref:Septum formation n=1 Tax=Arthrobacter alpinus TaxID=656366 RepID=A0A1H5MKW0_9MICC|nr:septum formation family protein [Arthrobacter alpinus]SEE89770.1 Septum formation [Arthrobacter alpinus]
MNESSNANDQDAPKSPSSENGDQPEAVISGSDYELAEPQLGVAEISEDVAEIVDLEAAAAEAARVEHEAELAAQGVSAPFTDAFEANPTGEAATQEEPIDWDSAQTVMRTDFTKPPVATNPWSPAADSAPEEPAVDLAAQNRRDAGAAAVPAVTDVPGAPDAPDATEVADAPSAPVAPTVPGEPEMPSAPVVPSAPEVPTTSESPTPPEAPESSDAPTEPMAPEAPPAPTTAPTAGNDHGWRRPETPWQQSATPWQPKAGQWQSPAQIARGHEETAAAAALAAGSLAAEQPTVPIEPQPDSTPTTASPQVNAAGSNPQQPYGQPPAPGQPNNGGPAPFGQAAASGQPPYGTPGQQGVPQQGAPQQGGPNWGPPQQGAQQPGTPQQGAPNWGAPVQFGAPGIPPVPGSGGPQGPNGPGYPGGPQGPGPQVPGFPNGPAGQGGGGMSPSAKKKLFIILGAVVLGLGLLAFFIWLLVGFIVGNVKNLDPIPAPAATSESQPLESPGTEPSAGQSAEQSAEASDAAEGSPDDGLILDALSPLDWLEGDCLRNFKDQSTVADVVLCSSPHNAQLVGTFYFEDEADYPGLEALKAKAVEVCDAVSFTSDAGDISTLKQTTAYPSETTWNEKDDRRVDCMVHDTRDGNPLTTDLIQ